MPTYHHPVQLSRNMGTLTTWNPLGPSGTALPFYILSYTYSSVSLQTSLLCSLNEMDCQPSGRPQYANKRTFLIPDTFRYRIVLNVCSTGPLLYFILQNERSKGINIIYCNSYLLTPCSRVLLEKLTGLQLVKKFPAFHGT